MCWALPEERCWAGCEQAADPQHTRLSASKHLCLCPPTCPPAIQGKCGKCMTLGCCVHLRPRLRAEEVRPRRWAPPCAMCARGVSSTQAAAHAAPINPTPLLLRAGDAHLPDPLSHSHSGLNYPTPAPAVLERTPLFLSPFSHTRLPAPHLQRDAGREVIRRREAQRPRRRCGLLAGQPALLVRQRQLPGGRRAPCGAGGAELGIPRGRSREGGHGSQLFQRGTLGCSSRRRGWQAPEKRCGCTTQACVRRP